MYFIFFHLFLNDFTILIFNLLIDVFLIQSVKAELSKKMLNMQKNLTTSNTTSNHQVDEKSAQKLKKKNASVERKANTLIIINLVIYIVCRLPELLNVFFNYYSQKIFHFTSKTALVYILANNFTEYCYYRILKTYFSITILTRIFRKACEYILIQFEKSLFFHFFLLFNFLYF